MNLNDLENKGEGIPARRYADYLILTPKELSFYTGLSVSSVRSYLNGRQEPTGSFMAFVRTLAFARSVLSDKDYNKLKGFLAGRITVTMNHKEECVHHERQG